jgi:hypothetical protein
VQNTVRQLAGVGGKIGVEVGEFTHKLLFYVLVYLIGLSC